MKRFASAVAVVAVFVCSVSSVFASDKLVKLDDAQLDGVTAGLFDINLNWSPVAVTQTATASTSQNAIIAAGVSQVAYAVPYNSSCVNVKVKQH